MKGEEEESEEEAENRRDDIADCFLQWEKDSRQTGGKGDKIVACESFTKNYIVLIGVECSYSELSFKESKIETDTTNTMYIIKFKGELQFPSNPNICPCHSSQAYIPHPLVSRPQTQR
jgi:predicted nucleic-acid-binding Zn-ribbon protein